MPARSSDTTSSRVVAAQLRDRELPGRHVREQLEHAVERLLVVLGLPWREQEDLRVDALEDELELLLVADVDHALEPEAERPRVVRLELVLLVVVVLGDQHPAVAPASWRLVRRLAAEEERAATSPHAARRTAGR